MALEQLQVTHFRNLVNASIAPSTEVNLFYGQNGSGKSNLLEAIYYLGHARSFRSRLLTRIIHHEHESFTLFGLLAHKSDLESIPVGLERARNGQTRIKVAHKSVNMAAALAKLFPIQTISANSYKIFDAGPKYRRTFLDWGLFHVEQSYFDLWKRLGHVITQRNALLKTHHGINAQLAFWDNELSLLGETIDRLRQSYFETFAQRFQAISQDLLAFAEVELRYTRGWDSELSYHQVLHKSLSRDKLLKYTQFGPHRADLSFFVKGVPAADVLSRGQQKLLANALHLTQGILLQELAEKPCAYLIDDLAAELDIPHRIKMAKLLKQLKSQVFVTGIELPEMSCFCDAFDNVRMFHVEHGTVTLTDE